MALTWLLLYVLLSSSNAEEIELIECEPPDIPEWGGYGPQLEFYEPGDIVHYYCDVDTFIGGNYLRICLDTGEWTGDTPVCDPPSGFKSTVQSSDYDEESTAELAIDGIRKTCTETIGGIKEEWYGNFTKPGELIRVMLFMPKGEVSYEVVLVKRNGEELICGSRTANIDRHEWTFHNCPGPHNTGAYGLKIRSLTSKALKICEIVAHVLTSPKCTDPHYRIESGRLRLNRKTATLVCNSGYTRSKEAKLQCIRDGEWNRKTLFCQERQWEVDNRQPISGDDGRHDPYIKPKENNP